MRSSRRCKLVTTLGRYPASRGPPLRLRLLSHLEQAEHLGVLVAECGELTVQLAVNPVVDVHESSLTPNPSLRPAGYISAGPPSIFPRGTGAGYANGNPPRWTRLWRGWWRRRVCTTQSRAIQRHTPVALVAVLPRPAI